MLLDRRQLPRMCAVNKAKAHRTLRTTAPIDDHHGGRTVEIQFCRGESRFGVIMPDLLHRDRYGRRCMPVCCQALCLRQSKRPRLVGLADDVGQICRQRHILAASSSHHQVDDGLVRSVVMLERVGCASKSDELRKRQVERNVLGPATHEKLRRDFLRASSISLDTSDDQ